MFSLKISGSKDVGFWKNWASEREGAKISELLVGKKCAFVLLVTGAGHELAALVEKAIWGRALVWLHGNHLNLQKNPSPFPS